MATSIHFTIIVTLSLEVIKITTLYFGEVKPHNLNFILIWYQWGHGVWIGVGVGIGLVVVVVAGAAVGLEVKV